MSDAVVAFCQVARSVAIGTCDASGRPFGTRAAALRLFDAGEREPRAERLVLYLGQALAGPVLANLAINPRVAIQLSQPLDYRTLQFKGTVLRKQLAAETERAFVQQFVEELAAVVDSLGMPADRVVRMTHWPAIALELQVEQIYLQTPGPGAGAPLAGRAP
jgi:Pyridoxamine 5'-phosphate oxidase